MTSKEPGDVPGSAPASKFRLAERGRVEAFSDGVFAIALTLLVLDLHSDAERGNFGHSLTHQWPSYLAYLAAFLNISAIWLSHHDLFNRVRHVDARLIGANLLILLVASILPFPTAVISSAMRDGNHQDQIDAALLYAGIGFFLPFAWQIVYRYLAAAPYLLDQPSDRAYVLQGARRSWISIIVYPLAGAAAFISPLIALVAFNALSLFFLLSLIISPVENEAPIIA